MVETFYITTAIDYVNARPHVGHAFEKVVADALARWHILHGEKVWFLTGTDENAQKNVEAAQKAKKDTKKFVDENSKIFVDLCKELDIGNSRFIRTTEKEHAKKAQEIFTTAYAKGDIYKGNYEGLYCTGCEAFKTEKELVDGTCVEHHIAPTLVSEEAYFFTLSKYASQIKKFVTKSVVSESRKREILKRLDEEGVKDISISRKGLHWGIPVPHDKDHTLYVWFDALINYVTGANGHWPADVHVIGKGINWFHSVIWPGILVSAGLALPKKILVHGYLNLGGSKISKSSGNVLDPIKLAKRFGSDSVRYSLLRCSVFDDSDYSEDILIKRHNTELLQKFGNLVSRVFSLAEKYGIEKTKNTLITKLHRKDVEKAFGRYELDKALHLLFSFVDECNVYVQEKKPWETHDTKVLYELVDSIKVLAIILWPFIPRSCEKIAEELGFTISYKNIAKPLVPKKIKKILLFERA
jgi:methionyl-tRNA synthetase